MRKIIIDRELRPRPFLVTPEKGSVGDMVDESQAAGCAIDAIIKKYGGNLPAVQAWPDGAIQLPSNRDELEEMAYNACEDIVNSGKSPFASVDEAINALSEGTFVDRIANYKPDVTTEVKSEVIPEVKPEVTEVKDEA